MQLTRAADYAVRVMIHLTTLPRSERILLPDLARATDVPKSFLSKILQALSRAKLISSKRGPVGGFEILPEGREASIVEIIEAIDGPIRLNLCVQNGRSCSRKPSCPAHPFWIQAQTAMLAVLNTAKVCDLGQPIKGRE
jgi:Rrf2 family protein